MLCSTSWYIERWENLKPQQLTKKFRKPNLLRFLREIGLRFVVNASRALLKKHHLFSETSWCNSSTSDCWSEGCVIKSLRGQVISYWHEMSNMKNAFFVTGYIWIFIYRLFFLAIRSLKKMETWMPKFKPISFEPELNQRPKDSQHIIYSPPLYQLSYRRIGRHNNTQRNLESLTSWVFWGKSGCVLW